jgi:nitric oxide reductase large subunit
LKPKEKKNLDKTNQIKYIVLNVAGQRIVFTKLFVFGISVISKTRFWIQWILHEWARKKRKKMKLTTFGTRSGSLFPNR